MDDREKLEKLKEALAFVELRQVDKSVYAKASAENEAEALEWCRVWQRAKTTSAVFQAALADTVQFAGGPGSNTPKGVRMQIDAMERLLVAHHRAYESSVGFDEACVSYFSGMICEMKALLREMPLDDEST